MKTIRIKLYKFSELSDDAKEKAISDRVNNMLNFEFADHYANWPEFKKAIDKAEQMQMPWFSADYVLDYCREPIMEMLNDQNDFLKNGSVFINPKN